MKQIEYLYIDHSGSYSEEDMYKVYRKKKHIFVWPNELKLLEDLQPTTKDIPKNSKVFFTKNITFPRFKARSFLKTLNCKITRDPEKADVIVYDHFLLKNNVTMTYGEEMLISKEYVEEFDVVIGGLIAKTYKNEYIYRRVGWKEQVLNFISDKAIVTTLYKGNGSDKDLESMWQVSKGLKQKRQPEFIHIDDFIEDVQKNNIMTYDSYYELKGLLESNNHEEKELAVAMLSDYNLLLNPLYIACLFLQLSQNIVGTKTYNTVAMKNLKYQVIKIFGIYKSSFTLDEQRIYSVGVEIRNKINDYFYSQNEINFVKTIVRRSIENVINSKFEHYGSIVKIDFDLNSSIFKTKNNYFKHDKAEQISRDWLGNQVSTPVGADISEHCE